MEWQRNRQRWLIRTAGYFDFICLPFVFWWLRSRYFPPVGWLADYYAVTPKLLLVASYTTIYGYYTSFIRPLWLAISSMSLLTIACSAAIFLLLRRWNQWQTKPGDYWWFGFGMVALYAGLFPYVVTGRHEIPVLYNWISSKQLLVPLGSTLMLVYGLKLLARWFSMPKAVILLVYSFLITGFITIYIGNYLEYQKDWYKQSALAAQLRATPLFRSGRSFYFNDEALGRNVVYLNGRPRRYYWEPEWRGLFWMAGLPDPEGIGYRKWGEIPEYAILKGDYDYIIVIEPGTYPITERSYLLRMMWLERFNPEQYRHNLPAIVSLRIIPGKAQTGE